MRDFIDQGIITVMGNNLVRCKNCNTLIDTTPVIDPKTNKYYKDKVSKGYCPMCNKMY